MNQRHRLLLARFILAPIFPIFRLVGGVYRILFGWLDVRASAAKREAFEFELKRDFPFLFGLHKGSLVPSAGVPVLEPFDYATVTVSSGNLLFRFWRGCGDLEMKVASCKTPNTWHDFHAVLAVVQACPELPDRRWFFDLQEMALLLDRNIALLKERFAADVTGEIDRRLAEFDKADRASQCASGSSR